ncbi:MAG TPA: ABC transporter substrate-binding protein [Actinomycetales bacterium]|nr:ABC transporter substrate-binding protein [Actinomycetales bacterium]
MNTRLRRLAGLFSVGISALLVAACGASGDAMAGQDAARESMSVATYPGLFLGMPLYAAQSEGFFEQRGLDVELVTVAGGPNQAAAVSSGSLDAFSFTVNSILALRAQGEDFRAIVNNQPRSQNLVFGSKELVEACGTARDPYPAPIACLKGRTVGVPQLGGDIYWVLRSLLEDAGLAIEDVDLVAVGASSNLPNAFQAKTIDYAVGVQPAPAMLDQSLDLTATLLDLSDDDVGDTFSPWVGQSFFALQSELERSPEKFELFQAAIGDATTWLQDPANTEKVSKLIQKELGVDAATANYLADSKVGIFDTRMSCEGIEKVSKWAVSTGQVKESDALPCAELVWSGATDLLVDK